ncbi:MAG: M42 family metallopeptidase [Planctomycetales bacterium]|nr:M42 family metallopeptidase [Planctomycetales bacterium]
MDNNAFEFLKTILSTPSPSVHEQQIQQVVREYVADFAAETTTDLHGNVIACVNPGAEFRVMFAGHCDQIGMLISHIDTEGFLYAQTIGGWDPQQLIGQRMTVWAESGPINAVISRKPIHLLQQEERTQVVKIEDMWLDIGAKSYDEASEVVRIGDPVTLKLGFQPLRNNLANAPGMDNRTGVWVVMEALRRCSKNNLRCSVYAVSTVQEEIGLRGARTSAFSIDPHVGIAVDVTHATDCPTIDKRQQGDIALGRGPVVFRGPNANPRVVERLANVAKEKEISFQYSALGRATSNDANTIQINRGGVAAGVVAIPNRYMHSAVETISLDDIDRAADLLAEFVTAIEPGADFTP